jgi:hypothetical protein
MSNTSSYKPTIYVVTPCLNAAQTIDRTLQSVLTQAGGFHLRYHVQDGGSSDGTWDRILWWQRFIDCTPRFKACVSVSFSASQAKDTGMYDAICNAFNSLMVPGSSFMSWINADDIFFQGALAYVAEIARQFRKEQLSWLTGAAANLNGDRLTAFYDRKIPSSALREGLCDGMHWDFLQQEGTFFRGWLWRSASVEHWLPGMKLAGDWYLWQRFAQQATVAQSSYPMGAFRIRDGQLSVRHRDTYANEINAIVPLAQREKAFRELLESGPVLRNVLRGARPGTNICLYREDITVNAHGRFNKLYGRVPATTFSPQEARLLCTGNNNNILLKASVSTPGNTKVQASGDIIAFDSGWQFPAITEQHAYAKMTQLCSKGSASAVYTGFPWATVIDHLQCDTSAADEWLRIVEKLAKEKPRIATVATVCQHILLKKYIHLFKACGITDIFWSHTTKDDTIKGGFEGIRLHPMPLYPVQNNFGSTCTKTRDLLFSFIGANPDRYYLTSARTWIFNNLHQCREAVIELRAEWHLKAAVYDAQIRGLNGSPDSSDNKSATERFADVLSRSVFSLCPSGTGPNSIRLWESLGAGAIPVIIADTLALPGDHALWEEAAVFCPENEEAIKALPERLAKLAEDTDLLERKRLAMRQLWLKYGPDCFVYDIMKLLVDKEGPVANTATTNAEVKPQDALPAFVGIARGIAAGEADPQTAGSILWRGLATRAGISSSDLQTTARRYPELLVAARMTKSLLGPETSGPLFRRVHEVLPELR